MRPRTPYKWVKQQMSQFLRDLAQPFQAFFVGTAFLPSAALTDSSYAKNAASILQIDA
jgi:hypothetical protein